MTNEEAKAVLMAMGYDINPRFLYKNHGHLVMSGLKDEHTMSAILDGDFQAAHVMAVACWMRDPEGVANA